MSKMKNTVLKRYLLCLFVLLLAFAAVTGTAKAWENSEFARTGETPAQVDLDGITDQIEDILPYSIKSKTGSR